MQRESKKLHLISLGCVKNLVDSEVMLGQLKDYEVIDDIHSADVIIVNTCGFIEAAKSESLRAIFDAMRDRKEGAILVVSGCLSERYRQELQKEMSEIDIITGVGDYDHILEMIEQRKGEFTPQTFLNDDSHERVITASVVHAYVKISEGCNQQCSFCAIPQFKGKLQSRGIQSIVKEVQNLIAKGYCDFSFVAQDSSSYLLDKGIKDGLIQLIKALEQVAGIRSVRFLYLYPSTTSLELIDCIAQSPIVQNYFDMPIQHISDSVLRRMRRGVNAKKHLEILTKMRDIPDSFIRTSLIVGYPEESELEFNELKAFLNNFSFDRVNLFGYSDEEGTWAYQNKAESKISQKIIHQRLKQLDSIVIQQQKQSLQKMKNSIIPVILEGESEYDFLYKARDMRWAPEVDGEILINEVEYEGDLNLGYYLARITEVSDEGFLIATLVQKYD
ncbi:30S ribosomal protein S12 methylthiotransferase RimO [Helicobacter monodelphidis]|uniref:30S ribosomal protein S12 methylthiotransferase RimO n=1 Tax=Helicobacter sp. 15-1451 TaxID=2004995 RepID=UPI000DCC3888|nr:30S ribosomal protein S12 methylthiotransferase RimO [Helicobacter sp. 15-1451]RAX58440.1 30S ribosomal protein S12 methylthiotransferase RimO [Helicobacter sp. 15-1451]